MSTPRPIAVFFGFSEVLPSAPKYHTLAEDEVPQRIRFFHLIVAVSKKGNIPERLLQREVEWYYYEADQGSEGHGSHFP